MMLVTDSAGVREAGPKDAPELVRLRHAKFRAMAEAGAAGRPDVVEDVSWYPAAREAIASRMAEGTLAAFVVEDVRPSATAEAAGGPPLVACAVMAIDFRLPGPGPGFPRGTSGSMSSVFVVPERRGRGPARAVVTAGLRWLSEKGAEVVDLHATPDAERLYRSLGFSEGNSMALRRVERS